MDLLTDKKKKIKKTEYRLSFNSEKKKEKRKIDQHKWCLTYDKLPIEKN